MTGAGSLLLIHQTSPLCTMPLLSRDTNLVPVTKIYFFLWQEFTLVLSPSDLPCFLSGLILGLVPVSFSLIWSSLVPFNVSLVLGVVGGLFSLDPAGVCWF